MERVGSRSSLSSLEHEYKSSPKDLEKGVFKEKSKEKEWKQKEIEAIPDESLNRRLLFMISYMLVISTFFGTSVGFVGPIFICFLWALVAMFCHLFCLYHPTENLFARAVARLVLLAILLSTVFVYYIGTHKTIHLMERELWDSSLLSFDRSILGGLFPEGQLALWADNNVWVGPNSFLGRLVTEILQFLYVSYYVWGNAFVIYLGWDYFYNIYKNDWRHDKYRWRKVQMILLCFVGGFLLNFFINFIFPAVSPRIYLADRYQNELRGFWIGDFMRGAIKKGAANSYGAFPSGHVGMTWVPALAASRLGYPLYGRLCGIAAAGITLATMFLRYHYFVDAACASLLVLVGLYFGRVIDLCPSPPTSK